MPFILLDRNEMTILTGLVHRFFGIGLDFEIPAGLLYGGFKTLGHEMVHGFDDRGRLYDKGRLNFKFQSIFGHFPAPWQVNTVSLNLPQFAKAFQCPEAEWSCLNRGREGSCSVW